MQDHRSTHLLFQNLCCLNRNFDLISIWNWIWLCIFFKFLIIFCQSLTQADSNYLPLVVHVCMFLLNDFVFHIFLSNFQICTCLEHAPPKMNFTWLCVNDVRKSSSHKLSSNISVSLNIKRNNLTIFKHPIRGALYHSF